MILKIIIVGLLIALIISLGSGLVFLFKDIGTTRRTLQSLGVRVTLATALMATIVYGFLSGQLGIGAPWDARKFDSAPTELDQAKPVETAGSTEQLDDVNEDK